MKQSIYLILFFAFCSHPPCSNQPAIQKSDLIGYYTSDECHECAGFSVGSLISDLELGQNNEFTFRNLAIRYGYNDVVTLLNINGNWQFENNRIILNSNEIISSKVDSLYNKLSDKKELIGKKSPIRFKPCGGGKILYPENKGFETFYKTEFKRFFSNFIKKPKNL